MHLFKNMIRTRVFLRAIRQNPLTAIKYFNRLLLKRNISIDRFNLQVFGPFVLKETIEVCREIGIEPFLNYGTLLGYYRNSEFIDTDNDIDFGIFENDKALLPDLKKKLTEIGYEVRIENKLETSFICRKNGNITVDFWIHYLHRESGKFYSGSMFENIKKVSIFPFAPEIFGKLLSAEFKNVNVSIPFLTENYLSVVYGDNWSVPLDREYSFSEKTNFIYPNKLMINESEFRSGNFL